MKKIFIISISAILGMFTQIDSSYAAGGCGIGSLDTSTNGRGTSYMGFTRLNGNAGNKESNYGLTTGSGQWATEFSYGTVWGMAKCSETSGDNSDYTWPESSKSDWLKTPSDTTGGNCWCQATGFTASGNSYTSGPQCTTTASSVWVFVVGGSSDDCARSCAYVCAYRVQHYAAFRAAMFGSVPPDQTVSLNWYNNGTTISGASSCTVGGTFVPPTPPSRTGYIFAGWKAHSAGECGIWKLDTSIGGIGSGITRFDETPGTNESNYGLTPRSGQWAVEFPYGTVWGMANCNNTNGTYAVAGTPTLASSGTKCWCQIIGFSPSGSDYTQGPQCTVSPTSNKWVYNAAGSGRYCTAQSCTGSCRTDVGNSGNYFRGPIFNAVGQ